MDGRFLTAFIVPETWDIMGYRLRPFSLRHIMYLEALQSPLVCPPGPATATPEDLLVFLRVCSEVHPSKAFRKPSLMDRWRIVRLTADTEFFFKALSEIAEYTRICSSVPVVYEKEADAKAVTKKEGIPPPLSLAVSLMSRCGFTKDEAWDCTLGQAIWYATTYAKSEGVDIRILTTDDEKVIDNERAELEKFQAEVLAKIKGDKKDK